MKYFLFVMLSLCSVAAVAHSGHGGDNLLVHAMDHALWLLGGFAVFAGVFVYTRRQ